MQMKGITACADCAYYSMGMHSCRRGATDEGEATARFYADCPLNDVVPVVHGRWIPVDGESPCDEWDCSACKERMTFMHEMDADDMNENFPRCPKCGAKMDGKENKDA